MPVEIVERPKRLVAEHTFVRITVPRPLSGDKVPPLTPIGEESPWDGDDVATILLPYKRIDHAAVSTGRASSILEVKYHGRLADRILGATEVPECARHILWLVHARVHVLDEYMSCQDDDE